MAESNYSLRPRKHVDYALLHQGKELQFPTYGFSPVRTRTPDHEQSAASPSPADSANFTEIQQLLAQAKEENQALEQTVELEKMRQELKNLRLRNVELERKRAPPTTGNGTISKRKQHSTTLRDLRSSEALSTQVEAILEELGETSSADTSDEEDGRTARKTKGKRRGFKSGKARKLTSRVLHPQLWPHSHLSLAYVSKEKTYDDLTLAEFTAGYAGILCLPTLSSKELLARIDHLSSLMYLATQFTWSSVRSFHAAVLFEIECGRANWGDSFAYLESRLLQSPSRGIRTVASRSDSPQSAVFFCRDFQHGVCKVNQDHYGTLRGERKWLQHICARCWVESRTASRHTEFSKECPLASHKNSSPSTTDTTTP